MRLNNNATVCLVLLIFAIGTGALFAQDYQAKIDALTQKIEDLSNQMSEVSDKTTYDTLLEEFNSLTKERQELIGQVTAEQDKESQAKIAFNKGGSLLKQRKYDEAVAEFDKAIAIDAKYGKAYYMKGYALTRLKRYAEAAQSYEKVLEINPGDSKAIFALGKLYEAQGEGKKAISLYEKALEADPGNAKAAYSIGAVYVGWDAYTNAVDAFNKAVNIDSTYDLAYTGLGTSLLELGKVGEAVDKLKKAISLDPKNNDSYYRLAKAYNSTGQYSDALTAADKAIQLARRSKSLKAAGSIEKGNALEGLGRKSEAKAAFQQAAQYDKKWKEWVDHHIEQMQ